MGGIFLSYRREDTAGYSGRLADSLRDNFGESVIFRDVDGITPGVDFVQAIRRAVEEADVMLAVIGRRWLIAKDSHRRRRIDDPEDYVRLEITTALELGRKVFPVLVDGAQMPRPEDVPETLRPFLRRQASELTDSRWSYDLGLLVDQLRPTLVAAETQQVAVGEEDAPATGLRRRRKRRLALLGLVSVLLISGTIVGLTQSRRPSELLATPAGNSSATTDLSTSSSSSMPEPTSTMPVATTSGGGRVAPPPTTRSTTVALPQPTPAPTTPPAAPAPTTIPATTVPPPPAFPYVLRSSDGNFGAHATANGFHLIVRRISTGDLVFTTQPQFASDPSDANNDVKAGKFCSASNLFAASYHYWGGTSIYSWIGFWSTTSGQLVQTRRVEGEVYVLDPYC